MILRRRMFLTVIKTSREWRTEMLPPIAFSIHRIIPQRNIMSQTIFLKSLVKSTLKRWMHQNYPLLVDLPRLESRFSSWAHKKQNLSALGTGVKEKIKSLLKSRDRAHSDQDSRRSLSSMPLTMLISHQNRCQESQRNSRLTDCKRLWKQGVWLLLTRRDMVASVLSITTLANTRWNIPLSAKI